MKKVGIASLLLLMASAAGAEDHLLPLGPGEGLISEKADKAWFKVFKQDDAAFVRFDVRPAFDAASHLAVFGHIEMGKKGPFRLCYMKGSYRQETPVCVPIGDEFAIALAAKVENIIRRDTHYSVTNNDVGMIDTTNHFFAGNFVFAQAYDSEKGSVPDQLIKALTKCEGLTQMKPDDAKRQALMDEVLNDLDAVRLP